MKNRRIESEFKRVKEEYELLELSKSGSGYIIEGHIGFTTPIKGEIFGDDYKIAISIAKGYPEKIPATKEIGGRIERKIENHVNDDGSMCLGVIAEIKDELTANYTLLEYIEKIIINFLSQYSYKEKHGMWPYGESAHYIEGVLDYYRKKYGLTDNSEVICFLKELAEIKFKPKGFMRCKCGCGKLIKNCRRQRLLKRGYTRNHDYSTEIKQAENFMEGN